MTDATATPDDLKRELKDRLLWLCSIFGQPSDLLRVLTLAEWRRLRTWVRGLEALAVELVRALAATMATSSGSSPPRMQRPAQLRAECVAPDTDYPDSARWMGVRFRFPAADCADASSSAAHGSPPRPTPATFTERQTIGRGFRSARSLALRLEAVIRVAHDAHRYAKRLAKRSTLPRSGTPRLAAQPRAPRIERTTALDPPLRPAIETG